MSVIQDAEQATKVALAFVKKHCVIGIAMPLKATKADGTWLVELDFGITMLKVGRVVVDAESGAIKEYEFPR